MPFLALLTLALSGCADPGDSGGKPKESGERTADADGDGHVDAAAAGGDDCDDADGTVYPGASDATVDGTDQDCDGLDGPDADADGYADAAAGGEDCDDGNAAIHPSAPEVCDGVDDDCDTFVDTDDPDLSEGYAGYTDGDGDGYGSTTPAISCEPDGVVADDSDCDDTNAAIHPSAPEVCNGLDDDCDTLVDVDDPDLTDGWSGYTDGDGDGYGSTTAAISCESGEVVADDSDCDDTDPSIHPGAPDAAVDGTDQDCDGFDGPDADGDGYADAAVGGEDCDDGEATVHPGATENCNGVDDDCDTFVDADDPDLTGGYAGYADADGDGYGSTTPAISCEPGEVAADNADCDDMNDAVYPGAPDVVGDGTDQDCDGVDGPDADGDGYADAAVGGEDCDDLDPAVNPAASDVIGSDSNCDGVVSVRSLADASYKLVGEDELDYAGDSVSSAGDVDGDGLADLLVGAFENDAGGRDAGAAYLLLGG